MHHVSSVGYSQQAGRVTGADSPFSKRLVMLVSFTPLSLVCIRLCKLYYSWY